MTLKGDTIFKEKLADGLKIDMRNLVNFHRSSRKSEHLLFDGLLLSTAYKVSAKIVQKSTSLMTLKSDSNFEEKLTFFV